MKPFKFKHPDFQCPPFCTVYDPLPPVRGGTPAFCGGNSGIPCPPTGLMGVISQPPGPDLRPGLFGLGDVAPFGHITPGTRIHWEATSMECGFMPSSTQIYNCLVGQLGPALVDVAVNVNNPLIGGISVQIDGTVGFERDSISDIESNLISALDKCGCAVRSSTPVTVVQNWSGTSHGQPSGDRQPAQPGKCDQETGLNWIACQMGLGGADTSGGAKLGLGTLGVGTLLILGLVTVFIVTR